jgi:hypothetical protein
MPSTDESGRPADAVAVARRYHSIERLSNALVASLAVAVFVGSYLVTTLPVAVGVAAGLVVVARAPVLETHGTIRLRTDAPPAAVVEEFDGPTPPVLAFQWGVADEVASEDGRVTYPVSYLFGLRAATMSLSRETSPTPEGHRIELELTVDGNPWGSYTATVRDADDGSVVDVEYESDRRFGLRRIPQQRLADRYRDEALEVQGYTVVSRESHLGV